MFMSLSLGSQKARRLGHRLANQQNDGAATLIAPMTSAVIWTGFGAMGAPSTAQADATTDAPQTNVDSTIQRS